MKLTVNSSILEKLSNANISIQDGIAFLLSLYYEVYPSYVPEILKTKVLALGIVTKDYSSDEIIWRQPLFEESLDNFEWIDDWLLLFKNKNPQRRGNKREVLKRMKRFFANNPNSTPEEVLKATKSYLNQTAPQYVRMSQRFIYEQDGSSMLKTYLDTSIKKTNNKYYEQDRI